MDTLVLADQQKFIFIISVQTLDVGWRTYQEKLAIGIDGKKDSREPMLSAGHDVNDDYDISKKVKLATVVEGNQKAPFQWLLHWSVGEGVIPFAGLLHFTLDMYLILLSVKQGGIKYYL